MADNPPMARNTKTVTFSIPNELFAKLYAHAKKTGLKLSTIGATAIKRYIDKESK